jgi:ribosome recycling factor
MMEAIKKNTELRMEKAIENLVREFTKIRTGRATVSLLDHIVVDYYGQPTPLSQVASVTVADARTLMVSPWEKQIFSAVEKAIMASNLGLNPVSAASGIRIPMPPLTEERRKELIQITKKEAEQSRVGIRNIRRDALAELKALLKDKQITEDEDRRLADFLQKLTDKFILEIDKILRDKEKDLMEI